MKVVKPKNPNQLLSPKRLRKLSKEAKPVTARKISKRLLKAPTKLPKNLIKELRNLTAPLVILIKPLVKLIPTNLETSLLQTSLV